MSIVAIENGNLILIFWFKLSKLLGTTYTHTHKMEEINNKEMHPGAIALYTQK